MIIKLLPEDIERYEKAILLTLRKAVPNSEGDLLQIYNNTLEGLFSHRCQAWIVVDKDGEIPKALCITSFIEDVFTGIKSLLIYALYADSELSFDEYSEGFQVFKDFAKFHKCKKILSYTDKKELVRIFSNLTSVQVRFYTEMEVS